MIKAECNGCRQRRYLNDKYLCHQCVELDEYDTMVADQVARESC